LKNGPVVRRCFNVARPSQGGARPLRTLAPLHGLINQSAVEKFAEDTPLGAPPPDTASLRLGSWLPINLREFLLAQFGGGIRIEDDVIYFLRPRASDLFVRDLARAIRRFSYIRAHEQWVEYAIERSQLEADLGRKPLPDHAVVLCLGCERVSTGTLAQHQGRNCVALVLRIPDSGSREQPPDSSGMMTGAGLYPVIEEFRQARRMAGLAHFGLDYYVAGNHVVFTWRRSREP